MNVGELFTQAGRTYEVMHVLCPETLIAKGETGDLRRFRIAELRKKPPVPDLPASTEEVEPEPQGPPPASAFDDDLWAIAVKRADIIKPLHDMGRDRTRADVDRVAVENGVSPQTIYNWLRAYGDKESTSFLVPERRGPKPGSSNLTEAQDLAIQAAIEAKYLVLQKHKVAAVYEETQRYCRNGRIPLPHINTVRRRVDGIPAAEALRARGEKDTARDRYEPIRGKFPGGEVPLACVQIDHTPVNFIIVDDVHRQPLCRPWLTLALDVDSKAGLGFYLTPESPSESSVGLCMINAILPKDAYLEQLGVPGNAGVCGLARQYFADNAREFHGKMITRFCEEHNRNIEWRPVKRPHFGGHIERMMGTASGVFAGVPGTTFSNPQERHDYDSLKNAVFTLKEAEAWFADWLFNKYNRRPHEGNGGQAPLMRWEQGLLGSPDQPGIGLPYVPDDHDRLRIELMPFEERTVQPYGIVIDKVHYYHDCLKPWIGSEEGKRKKRQFLCRIDPREVTKIWFLDPKLKRYFVIPTRDPRRKPISRWELRRADAVLRKQYKGEIDENALFETAERLRQRLEDATAKTAAARRAAARAKAAEKAAANSQGKAVAVVKPSSNSLRAEPARAVPTPHSIGIADLIDGPVTPFDADVSSITGPWKDPA